MIYGTRGLIILTSLLFVAACTMTVTVEDNGTINLTTPTREAATWTPEPVPEIVGVVTTSGGNLNCRSEPNGAVVMSLPDGSEWVVTSTVPGWHQVKTSTPCWVSSTYFEIQ